MRYVFIVVYPMMEDKIVHYLVGIVLPCYVYDIYQRLYEDQIVGGHENIVIKWWLAISFADWYWNVQYGINYIYPDKNLYIHIKD